MKKVSGILISEDKNKWPDALAVMFADMDAEQQAEFFNNLAIETALWQTHHSFQWRYMQKHLSPKGKEIIDAMKDHTDP